MIKVILVKNPFDVRDKVVYMEEFVEGKPLSGYHAGTGGEYRYAINGIVVLPDASLQDGDELVVLPYVGKKAFGWILSIGLAIVTGMITGGTGFAAGWSIGVKIGASVFVSVLGGMLVNKLTPMPKMDFSNTEQSNTYGWGGAQTVTGQGYVLPVLYGRMKTGGIMLQRHVVSEGDKQYLNILYCLCEGPIDSVTDIRLNGNPIANYEDVEVEIRLGTNDQRIISNFNDSYADTSLSYELNADSKWATQLLAGNTTEGIEVTLGFPRGLFRQRTSHSGTADTSVTIECQYRITGGTWNDIPIGKITKNETKAFYLTYRVTGLTPAQYEVRMRCTAKDGTATNYANTIQWQGVTQIITDDFRHPGKVLLGLKALATDQLSGSDPRLTCIIERKNVYVHTGSGYIRCPANNPAWAAYDILHHCRYLGGKYLSDGVRKECLDYYAFSAWAEACQESCVEFNYLYDTAMRTWDALVYPARIGRGVVLIRGTIFTCVYDYAAEPSQLFTVANIKKDTFKEEFQGIESRANAIEVSFLNADKEYERDVVTVYGDSYDTDDTNATPVQLELMGCTSAEQAYKYGVFKLLENRYEIRTVSFEAFTDAIACTIGDVVLVQSDATVWGAGGRVKSVSGKKITLDQAVDNTYTEIIVRDQQTDTLYTTTITAINGNVITVAKASGFSADAVYSVGKRGQKALAVKVLSIDKNYDELSRTITGIEYHAELYDADDSTVPEFTAFDNTVYGPKNLMLSWEIYTTKQDTAKYVVSCTWQNAHTPNPVHLEVAETGQPWKHMATMTRNETSFSFDAEENRKYTVRIYAENTIGRRSAYAYASIDMSGLYAGAPTPTNIYAQTRYRQLSDGVSRHDIVVHWGPAGTKGRVYYKTNHDQALNLVIREGVPADQLGFEGPWTFAGEGVEQIVIPQAIVGDTYRIAVTTADEAGRFTTPELSPSIDFTVSPKSTLPNTPADFTVAFGQEAVVSWGAVTNADIAFYEVRADTLYGVENGNLLLRTNDNKGIVHLAARRDTLYLYACSADNKYSAPATLTYNQRLPGAPPKPRLTAKLGGIGIVLGGLPPGSFGFNVYIAGGGAEACLYTDNSALTYSCDSGVYEVTARYVDYFGEGLQSAAATVTVKTKIDDSMIEAEAISLNHMDERLKAAVADAENSVQELEDLANDLSETSANVEALEQTVRTNQQNLSGSIQGIITEMDKAPSVNGYKAIADLNTSLAGLTATVANNKTNQDGTNSTLLSRIEAAASQISTIVANLNSAPDGTTYAAITQLYQTAEGLRTQVLEIVENVQDGMSTDIAALSSEVSQTSSSIDTIISNLNHSASGNAYAAVAELHQRATSLAATISTNKTTQDGINENVAASLTARADEISTVVTNLNKEPGSSPYKSITRMKQTVDGISSTVASNKTNQDGINTTMQSQIEQAADAVSLLLTNLGDTTKAAKAYAAINALVNQINLRVQKGEIVSQINLTDQGTVTIDGKYLHVTGDTVFDDDVVIKGIMTAGAISCDDGVDINAGAVSITGTGMKVATRTGGQVSFDEEGMSFLDSNGNAYANVGRMLIGTASHNQTVRFAVPWEKVPNVLVMPQTIKTQVQSYSNTDLKVVCEATNVTANGFKVNCYTTLGTGSSGTNTTVITLEGRTAAGTRNTTTYSSYSSASIQIPSTASHVKIICAFAFSAPYHVTSGGGEDGPDAPFYYNNGSAHLEIQLLRGSKEIKSVSSSNVSQQQGYTGLTVKKETITLESDFAAGATSLTVRYRVVSVNSKYYGSDGGSCSSAVINSVQYNVTSDVIVGTGTATYIAIENPNG